MSWVGKVAVEVEKANVNSPMVSWVEKVEVELEMAIVCTPMVSWAGKVVVEMEVPSPAWSQGHAEGKK